MKRAGISILCCIVIFCTLPRPARAFLSPHPVQMYEQGEQFIQNYDGDISNLVAAQDIFVRLILKYPHSPFGYLGMSHIYRIDAYLGEENYDMKTIRARALPFALRAMKLGPSIREVHENYAFFERFFNGTEGEGLPRLDFSP